VTVEVPATDLPEGRVKLTCERCGRGLVHVGAGEHHSGSYMLGDHGFSRSRRSTVVPDYAHEGEAVVGATLELSCKCGRRIRVNLRKRAAAIGAAVRAGRPVEV
jgi:hypothetical protein